MPWTFEVLDYFLNLIEVQPGGKSYISRFHHEALPFLRPMSGHQAQTKQAIDRPFKGFTRTPHFLLNKLSYIIVDGKSGSHITMF